MSDLLDDVVQVADDDSQAVVDVAQELDRARTWRQRLRDVWWSARLFVAVVWHHVKGR